MIFKHPTLVFWANYKHHIEVGIGIGDKVYKYRLPITAWALRLPDRKRLTFRDVNRAKKWGEQIEPEKTEK